MVETEPLLKRPRNPMPDDIAALLRQHGLAAAYATRPPYQRNDYLGWIARARRPKTRQKRVGQMLDELRAGNIYMKMAWRRPAG